MTALQQVTEEPLIWGPEESQSQLQPRIVKTSCNENQTLPRFCVGLWLGKYYVLQKNFTAIFTKG